MNFNPILNVCGEILGNSRLMQYISIKHDHLPKKTPHYFKWLFSPHKNGCIGTIKIFKVTDYAHETMYLVPEILVKEMKPHTVGEILIHLACAATVKKNAWDWGRINKKNTFFRWHDA